MMDEDIACEIDIDFCVSLHSIVFSGIRGVPQTLGVWCGLWDGQTWRDDDDRCVMYITLWWESHTLVFHSSGMQGKRNINAWAFLCSPSTCAWRDAMQIWNSRFQILQAKLVNSTRGYFPDLIFTSAIMQRRACALRLHLRYRLHNLLLTTWSMQWLGTTHNQATKKNLEVFQKQYLFMVSPHFIFSPSPPLASFSLNFSLIGL